MGTIVTNLWSAYFATARTAWDAYTVITLRLMRLAGGGALAQREANLMVAEKVKAGVQAQAAAASAMMAGKSVRSAAKASARVYRRKVSANRRRLTRS
jgi:hypothetical protein